MDLKRMLLLISFLMICAALIAGCQKADVQTAENNDTQPAYTEPERSSLNISLNSSSVPLFPNTEAHIPMGVPITAKQAFAYAEKARNGSDIHLRYARNYPGRESSGKASTWLLYWTNQNGIVFESLVAGSGNIFDVTSSGYSEGPQSFFHLNITLPEQDIEDLDSWKVDSDAAYKSIRESSKTSKDKSLTETFELTNIQGKPVWVLYDCTPTLCKQTGPAIDATNGERIG